MAHITASVYTSHVPAVGAAIDLGKTAEPYWKLVFDGYEFSKQWMKDHTPDVIFLVYNDHATAFSLEIIPTFAIGTAAVASLKAEGELLDRVAFTVKERERVRDALAGQGWTLSRTEANFVWLRLGADTQDFAVAAARAGVAVRPFGAEGARVSIGDHDANDAFLSVARAYPRRH